MKLHLPKMLLTAVLAAVFCAGNFADAMTIKDYVTGYDSYTFGEDTIPEGWTYTPPSDGSTIGILTGADNTNFYFTLNTEALTTDNKNQHVVYGTNDHTTVSAWGFNTNGAGTGLQGYWSGTTTDNGTWGSSQVTADTISNLPKTESGDVILEAAFSKNGTYLYDQYSNQLYGESGLKSSDGNIAFITINEALVNSILYNVTTGANVSNADGTWNKKYDTYALNAFPTTKVDATIISNASLQISGSSETQTFDRPATDLVKNGGDIVIGNQGCLFLQTWQGDHIKNGLNIDLSDADIYMGAGSDGYGALRLAAWSGNIILGNITLIENTALWKEAAANGNTVSFNGAITGDYTLEIKQLDATTFNDVINIKGITTTGTTAATFSKTANVTVGTLTTKQATTFTVEDGANVTFDSVSVASGDKLTINGDGVVNVSGILKTNAFASMEIAEGATLKGGELHNAWGMNLTVNGVIELGEGGLQLASGSSDKISGTGTIKTDVLGLGNVGEYTIEGVRLEIGSGGIQQSTRSGNSNNKTILGNATIAATESWENDVTKNLRLSDSVDGTTFEIAKDSAVVLAGVISDHTTTADEVTTTHAGKLVKEGEGTLSLTATNTYSGGTVVNEGKVEAASGAALGTGNITVAHGASVEITEGTGTITVEAYKDNTDAVIEKAVAYNNASSDSILMGNAKVTVDYADDVTITNIIGKDAKSSAIVNKGTGTVTLTNGFNNLTHIHAQNGDINLQWVMYQKDVTSIILEDGRTLGAHHRDDALTSTANEATLTVTEVATFGKGASLYGNLNLKSGVTLSMDGALSMGSELTLATNLTLDGELMSSLNSLELGSTLLLFSGVDKLTLDTTVYTTLTEDDGYDMSDIFSNVTSDKYYLGYNENGDVYAGVIAPATPVDPTVPEPTTATLSLLALAALAARRRRR